MSVIEIKGVSFVYGKKTPYEIKALDNINMYVRENSITETMLFTSYKRPAGKESGY